MMKEKSEQEILKLLEQQRAYFMSQATKDVGFRLEKLKALKNAILQNEKRITDALWADLHKSPEEAYLTEISMVVQEIDNHIRHLRRWAKPRYVHTPLHLLPSSSKVISEPLGVALIVSPWNYPFQLLMNPLVGAISAGNCAMLKPSPYTMHTALVMEELIAETFAPEYVSLLQGGKEVNQILFAQKFDIIFYTGSPMVGKVVMKAAAQHLTPLVLELGGKSPCIVDADANLAVAARRIVWGKTINAGQTCIAPDYLLVHESVKDELLSLMTREVEKMYGKDLKSSRFFPRIVNNAAFERLSGLLKEGRLLYGGQTDAAERFIGFSIVDGLQESDVLLREEIFGPILPVVTVSSIHDAISYVNKGDKPLAFYYFGKNKTAKDVLAKTTSGGACINDTIMHIANHLLPFGGVGNSGMGKYHGHTSFQAFSNQRSVLTSPTWIDVPLRYVPFRMFDLVKKII